MKKRLIAIFLLTALLLACLPGVSASGVLCFVAVNDSIPLYLPKEDSPFYYNNDLYIPYTAYDANPAGVVVSKNTTTNSLALFTKAQRLVYDLDNNTVTNEENETREVPLIYSNGILFLPSSDAAHFGLTVSLLYSQTGCPIIRFTTGANVYDDALFVEKAENFISYTLAENLPGDGDDPVQDPNGPDQENPGPDTPETDPATIYLAFAGSAVTQNTLEFLNGNGITAAFFLTREQFASKPELAQAIYAAGHTIGVTAPVTSVDWSADLAAANEAMDQVLFCKSLLALVPQEQAGMIEGYFLVQEPAVTPTIQDALMATESPQLLVCRTDMTVLIESLLDTEASLPQLLETTKLPDPVIPTEETEEQ